MPSSGTLGKRARLQVIESLSHEIITQRLETAFSKKKLQAGMEQVIRFFTEFEQNRVCKWSAKLRTWLRDSKYMFWLGLNSQPRHDRWGLQSTGYTLRNRIVLESERPRTNFQRILVTGGAGFIGSHLVDVLASRGFKVRILDNLSTGTLKNIQDHLNNKDADLVKADVRNIQEVKRASRDIDVVFHLAAITSVPYSINNPTMTNEVNAEGTRNLLEASVDNGVKYFVYTSSCSVYGEPRYLPVDEEHPLNPISPYAESKARGEMYCREFMEKYDLNTVNLRLFNVYGTRQSDNEYSGVVLKFIKRIEEGNPPIIYGDGQETRDFVHVDDVVEATLLGAKNSSAPGHTFNIGYGKPITITKLCQLTLERFGAKMEPIYLQPRPGDIKHSWADIEKGRKILGYNPEISLEEGLQEVIKQQVRRFA